MKRYAFILICAGVACLCLCGNELSSADRKGDMAAPSAKLLSGDQMKWSVMSSGGTIGSSSAGRLQGTLGQMLVGDEETQPQPWVSADSVDTVCAVLANGFWHNFDDTCCVGLTGNVDCDPLDQTDISDLSALIDHLFISFQPLCCKGEANVDGDINCSIDISDLSALIDYLFISFTPTAGCQ